MSTYNWVGFIDYLSTPEYNYDLYPVEGRGLGGLTTAYLSVYVKTFFDSSNAEIAPQAP
jgi:hypothetical protein